MCPSIPHGRMPGLLGSQKVLSLTEAWSTHVHTRPCMQDIEVSCEAAAPHPLVAQLFRDMLDQNLHQRRPRQQQGYGSGGGSISPAIELKPVPATEVPPAILELLKE